MRITGPQIDREIAEFEFTDKLRVEQLAFVPAGILEQVVIIVGQIVDLCQGCALERVPDKEIGQAEPVLADLETEAEHRICEDALVGLELRAVLIEIERAVHRDLAGDEAVAPFVAERGGGDDAETSVGGNVEARACRDPRRPVDGQFIGALEEDLIGIAQFEQDRLLIDLRVGDLEATVEERLQIGTRFAATVVETEPVIIRAVIAVSGPECGFGVAGDAGADLDEAFVRYRAGREVDHAAAEFAREVGRVGFLHEAGRDDAGREDVERDDTAQRLRRGQGKTIEQGERITIAKAANEDETVPHGGKARHAGKGARNVAFAGAGDAGTVEHGHDLRGRAGDVLPAASRDNDRATGHRDIGFFEIFFLGRVVDALGLLCLKGIGSGIFICGYAFGTGADTRILSECRCGQGERGGEQEQRSKLLAGRHGSRPPHIQAFETGVERSDRPI